MTQWKDEDYDWKEHKSSWSDVGALAVIAAVISVIWVALRSLPI